MRYPKMDYRQRVCPHGIKAYQQQEHRCVFVFPIQGTRCHEPFPCGALTRELTTFFLVQAYSLAVRTVNLRCVFPLRPLDTFLWQIWNGKFMPQGFPGKSPRPLSGVVFCLKNLPYPFSDLLEAAGTKQTAIEIRKKKTKGSRSSD